MPLGLGLLESRDQLRERFLGNVMALVGDTRVLWTPKPTDTTTALEESLNGRTITWDATVAARLSALGNGYAQSFVSGSTQYGTAPDAANLSFGTGAVDSSFSIVVLANVSDTAAIRAIVSKFDVTAREWRLAVDASDKLALALEDESVPAQPNRTSDAAITQGSWHLFGATYDVTAGSGATAANGITLYQDGAVIASTATNVGTYVAMENGTGLLEISGHTAHTANLYDGSLALVIVCAGALSASQFWALKRLVNAFFRLSL
jgi:hypothetical protein